jgi:hypothetical protein
LRERGVSNWLTGKSDERDLRECVRSGLLVEAEGPFDGIEAERALCAIVTECSVRSSSVACLLASGEPSGDVGFRGRSSSSDSLCGELSDSVTASKEVVRDMVMRVRSINDMDMRGCGFLTGDGVALPMASIMSSARASSGSRDGIRNVGIGCAKMGPGVVEGMGRCEGVGEFMGGGEELISE